MAAQEEDAASSFLPPRIAYARPLDRRRRLEAAAAEAAAARLRRQRQRARADPQSVPRAAAIATLITCACAAALALARRIRHQQQQPLDRSRRRKANKSNPNNDDKNALALGRRRRDPPDLPPELAAAIPKATLRPLCALLEAVYALRGWRGGGYHYERAWERALEKAQTPEAGGWEGQFDAREPGAVTRATLKGLARCLDVEFFGGALHGLLMRRLWEEEKVVDEEKEASRQKAKKNNSKTGTRTTERAAARAAGAVLASAAGAAAAAANGNGGGSADADNDDDERQDDDAADEERENGEAEAAAIAGLLGLPGARSRSGRRRSGAAAAASDPARSHRKGSPWRHDRPLTYTADPLHWPDAGYVAAYSSDHHAIRVSRRAWALKRGLVTAERPLNCEGWRTDSLLAALAHSLAHELVHALVAACFPAVELGDRSYLGEDGSRHGAAFALLNRCLFGHTSPDALEWVGSAAGGRR